MKPRLLISGNSDLTKFAGFHLGAALLVASACLAVAGPATVSRTPEAVLRQPLPPEELKLSETRTEFIIAGPTFSYGVQRATGVIGEVQVMRDGREVIHSRGPAEIRIDNFLFIEAGGQVNVSVVNQSKGKVVLRAEGILRQAPGTGPEIRYKLVHTFFNDGVLVSEVALKPSADLGITNEIAWQFPVQGAFASYLHKRRDEHGHESVNGLLPEAGKAIRFTTLTSCLQVFSPEAGLALFTDSAGTHLSQKNLDTAVLEVARKEPGLAQVSLAQYMVRVAPGDQPYVLPAGKEFTFRVGLSLAPCRLPDPRVNSLRMFTWIGDTNYPYATDQEIAQVAKWGFSLFQMHRVGTPGEPRPPAGELQRVIKKVHESGMLFLWEENADLLYASAPGVQKLKQEKKWFLWEGFNYGGRYTDSMDSYCDLVATCLASPNGLAEYRLANIDRMLDRFDVDGIYLDDNLAYANCTLWKEHGHPRPTYDCLIELHEMNWRRRELLRQRCPHTVLVSHNTRALVLPVVCNFDILLYGEGYSFESPERYWDFYCSAKSLPAQGMIWPGGKDPVRCAAALAYNYDLLTGGGQYSQIDWRLFPKKFPWATGVSELEPFYSVTYNLAQYYFGMHESAPFYFATSSDLFKTTVPHTYATVYRNQFWNDWLIVIANMSAGPLNTSLQFSQPGKLGVDPEREYILFNIHQQAAATIKGSSLSEALTGISIPGQNLQLYSLRRKPADAPLHLWGGKRISEEWDSNRRELRLRLQGPAGLEETVVLNQANRPVREVLVEGKKADFFFDPGKGLVHGMVKFTTHPVTLDAMCGTTGSEGLPRQALPASPLARQTGLFNP
jgi:hypothetical protein